MAAERELLPEVIGGAEETTTGVIRLRSLAAAGKLRYPIIAVNDADTKHFFDNRYGTGQSTLDGITRATNVLWAGKKVVICGYGWCGRGVALRARGMGAHTIVTEVNPIPALEAAMDGHQVMTMGEAARIGDIFITLTGGLKAISRSHLELMKDGAILANSGHFNVEIDIEALEETAEGKRRVRPFVDEYLMSDGRRLYLLGEGRLINLVAAEGHPAAVMDMSFANQALTVEYLTQSGHTLSPQVYPVPQGYRRGGGQTEAELHGDSDRLPYAGAGGLPGKLGNRYVRSCLGVYRGETRISVLLRLRRFQRDRLAPETPNGGEMPGRRIHAAGGAPGVARYSPRRHHRLAALRGAGKPSVLSGSCDDDEKHGDQATQAREGGRADNRQIVARRAVGT